MMAADDPSSLLERVRVEGRLQVAVLDLHQLALVDDNFRRESGIQLTPAQSQRAANGLHQQGFMVESTHGPRVSGVLADVLALSQGPQRITAHVFSGYPGQEFLEMATVLLLQAPDMGAGDVFILRRYVSCRPGPAGGQVPEGGVRFELVRKDVLLEELLSLAFREPLTYRERSEQTGTETVFAGPDRRTPVIASRLVHDWNARNATLYAWHYSLFGRRTDGDWIARQASRWGLCSRSFYRNHLAHRLVCRDPAPAGGPR